MDEVILAGLKKVPRKSCRGCVFQDEGYVVCKFIKCNEDNEEYILVEE